MADSSAADCIQGNLLEVSPNIIRVAEQRKFVSEEANKLLLLCKPTNDSSCNDDEENENILSAGKHVSLCMYRTCYICTELLFSHFDLKYLNKSSFVPIWSCHFPLKKNLSCLCFS